MSKQRYLNAFTGEYEILDEEEAKKLQEKLDYITFNDYLELKRGQPTSREIHLLHEIYELKCYKVMYDKARERVNSLSKDREHTQEDWLHANMEVAHLRNAIMYTIDHILF